MAGETATLLALLERHYIKPGQPLPGGIFLPEVGKNGSWGRSSRCDAIYVGFTSTSGRLLVGHELKVSRSDWLHELNSPGKADTWADQCHEWWLVTVPGVVEDGELPDGWGLMVPGRSRTRMRILTPARRHSERQPSWDVARSIMARQDTLRAQAITAARAKAAADVQAELNDLRTRVAQQSLAVNAEQLRTELEAYREALGGRLSHREGRAHFRGEHTPTDLADLAGLLRTHVSLTNALEHLLGRYSGIDGLRRSFERFDGAVTEAREAVTAHVGGDLW